MLKKLAILAFILLTCPLLFAYADLQQGSNIFEIKADNIEQLQILQTLFEVEPTNYDFFGRPSLKENTRVLVNKAGVDEFRKLLLRYGIEAKIIDEDYRSSIERELKAQRLLRILKPYREGQRLGTDRYYTHDEINRYIVDLAKRYPKRVHVKTVGKSFEGRLLKTIKITNGDGRLNKNVVLMDGGFHAREWISPAAAVYAIGELVENFDENSDLLLDYDWIVLPVVNADGYEYTQISADTRMWRKTRKPSLWNGDEVQCYGTDPNRNFDFHWNEEGASSDPCSNTYAGPKAFSEPETIAVRDLINTYKVKGIMYLTLHSHGQLILYPWGWTSDLPDTWPDLHEVGEAGANAIREATGTIYTVGSSTNVLYVAAGASDDYAFNAGFPISYTMELPAGGSNNFDPPASSIDSYVKETWIGIRAMAKKINVKYPL